MEKPCRWSIGASLLFYVIVFILIKVFRIPLKADGKAKILIQNGSLRTHGDIIEYLHKLHNLKKSQKIREGEEELIQSFYIVEEVFRKADYNHDQHLNSDELSKWINIKTQEHIHEAIVENYKIFLVIDVRPKNGLISWNEYQHYLERNEFNQSVISDYNKKYKRQSFREISTDEKIKETLKRHKSLWNQATKNDPDHLTLDEFLSFKHPESSYSTIISLADEIYKKFDRDGDDVLTEDEFSTFQIEGEYEAPEIPDSEEFERRREFREMVDQNKDGMASRKEILTYIDPKNPRHAKEEAETLIELADLDKDGRLSLYEVFNKIDLFLGSKMIDTAKSFHDEL